VDEEGEVSAVKRLAAYWDWTTGAAVPDARIVVCAPGTYTKHLLDVYGRHQASDESGNARPYVVPFLWSTETPPYWFIPAIHVTHQADLARLPDLLAVKAERRALVLTPGETIDLVAVGALGCGCPGGHMDLCHGGCAYAANSKRRIDVVFIVGGDAPVHPDWVRTIVEQCRAVGVPVVFLGWGSWLPQSQGSGPFRPTSYVFLNRDGRLDKTGHSIVTNMGWVGVGRVDGEHSGHVVDNRIIRGAGALLDGKPIEDVPTWVGGGE
jgi:hypothetical protein